MSIPNPTERPEPSAASAWTDLPRRFDHYRQPIEGIPVEIRGRNRSRKSNTVNGTVVTVQIKAGVAVATGRRQRIWQSVERAVLHTFREGDIKLSDGQSALVALSSVGTEATSDLANHLRDRLWAQLQVGLRVESADRYLDVDVVVPLQQDHKSCEARYRTDHPTNKVYEIRDPEGDNDRRWGVLDRAFRRLVDVCVASLGIIIAAPLMLLIGVFIRQSSPGPVLFRQSRVGRNGEMFTMLKFRTMHVGVDDQPHRSYMKEYVRGSNRPPKSAGEESPIFKLNNDSRIFWFGSLLRQWSLDELPQLFNVLSGDMSLVGPRPSVYYELEDYQPWHRERLAVRPGLTGLWQIYGRGRTTFDEMVRLDIQYVRRRTIWLDLKLLLLTGPAVFGRIGAQ